MIICPIAKLIIVRRSRGTSPIRASFMSTLKFWKVIQKHIMDNLLDFTANCTLIRPRNASQLLTKYSVLHKTNYLTMCLLRRISHQYFKAKKQTSAPRSDWHFTFSPKRVDKLAVHKNGISFGEQFIFLTVYTTYKVG